MPEQRKLSKKEIRRRKRQREIRIKLGILIALLVVLVAAIVLIVRDKKKREADNNPPVVTSESSVAGRDNIPPEQTQTSSAQQSGEVEVTIEPTPVSGRDEQIAAARLKATQYDYDGAIETLAAIDGADSDSEIIAMMADLETQKSALVGFSPTEVTHIFFHSLVVDPARGFSVTDSQSWNNATAGFCQWMTTVDEFNAIMQQMYDRGYVIISLYDMVNMTTDADGVVHMTPRTIWLPQGKTPFVMSLDDTCYYHSYDGRGCATRLIVGDDGRPTCEYVDAEGNGHVGAYDCIPLFDQFLDAHPDFSYRGAKGTVALTGYNGILGYRTDYCYRDRVELTADQQAWLDANPNYNWEAECAAAKQVADCIKADGWTFASHTWGHIRIGDADMEWLRTDTQKFKEYVDPLIGGTDIIIFAHGQDLAAWNEVYSEAEKFQYLKSQGYDIYCNVDSSQYFVQMGDLYLRMGRRDLDGYRIWEAVYGGNDRISDLVDAATVIDPLRPTDAWLYEL